MSPRPRKWESDAEKQRAYRQRRKAQLTLLQQRVDPRPHVWDQRSGRTRAQADRAAEEAKALGFLKKLRRPEFTMKRFIDALYIQGLMDQLVALGAAGRTWQGFVKFQWRFLHRYTKLSNKEMMGICTRGGSKTMLGAIGTAYLMFHIEGFKWATSAGALDQAEQFYDYLECIFEHFDWCVKQMTSKKIVLYNKSRWQRLPSSGTGARAKRADGLALDESAEMKLRVLKGYYGQVAASKHFIIRNTTTPHLTGASSDYLKKEWNKPGVDQHTWTAYDCPWISPAFIEIMKDKLSHEEFKAEMLGQWGAKVGHIYIEEEVDASVMTPMDLLKLYEYLKHLRITIQPHAGIDWGTVHQTVCIKGFLAPGVDNQGKHRPDILYVYAAKAWNFEQNQNKDQVIREIVEFVKVDKARVYSEENPESSSDNYRLEKELLKVGLKLIRVAFGRKSKTEEGKETPAVDKQTFVSNDVARFNHGTVRILNTLTQLVDQTKDAEYEEDGSIKKVDPSDWWDAKLHLNQSFHKFIAKTKWEEQLSEI
jgi:hypothetical protein